MKKKGKIKAMGTIVTHDKVHNKHNATMFIDFNSGRFHLKPNKQYEIIEVDDEE